jgi:hypothetical protein
VAELYDCSKADVCERFWPALTASFDVECAHISQTGKVFQGCVFDYQRASCCPATVRRLERRSKGEAKEE